MSRQARWWGISALAVVGLLLASRASPQDVFRPQDFATTATFQLVVQRSTVLKLGASTIVAPSAFASRLHRLMPGNSEGLEILFFSQPITDGGLRRRDGGMKST